MEGDLHSYYGWLPYWHAGAYPVAVAASAPREQEGDPHLRSTKQVIGYHIQAQDGEIGHVEDFIVEDDTWVIRYLVVNTQNWLSGKSVLVAPSWVKGVDWAKRRVHLDLEREAIEKSPEFDPATPVNREYEVRLYDYYGRPQYWIRLSEEERAELGIRP
jgi:hypothetical protein